MTKKPKAIGPVPIQGPGKISVKRGLTEFVPFTVDKNDPDCQALAAAVGWGRLYEIEAADKETMRKIAEGD